MNHERINAWSRIAITGSGFDVPETRRGNDAPIFNWLKENMPAGAGALFYGYEYRRVLPWGVELVDIMAPAASRALEDAGIEAKDVDVTIGYGSIGEFVTPNALAQVHARLGLRTDSLLLPLDHNFSGYMEAIAIANALVAAGQARNCLIVFGSDWTRFVSYETRQAVSASDGAGACVVAPTMDPKAFRYVDIASVVQSKDYGAMQMRGDVIQWHETPPWPAGTIGGIPEVAHTSPYFHLTAEGAKVFKDFGLNAPVKLIEGLLAKHDLRAEDITLITHQASARLMDAWNEALEPGQYLSTIEKYANMTVASVPVTFASEYDRIDRDWLVILGLTTDIGATATLLRRNG
ncbi:MAG: 3-oxoacyl-ACP synthase III family protein [Gemmatimonadota bacterium]